MEHQTHIRYPIDAHTPQPTPADTTMGGDDTYQGVVEVENDSTIGEQVCLSLPNHPHHAHPDPIPITNPTTP